MIHNPWVSKLNRPLINDSLISVVKRREYQLFFLRRCPHLPVDHVLPVTPPKCLSKETSSLHPPYLSLSPAGLRRLISPCLSSASPPLAVHSLCCWETLSKSWTGTWQSFALKVFLILFTYRLRFLFLRLALACKAPGISGFFSTALYLQPHPFTPQPQEPLTAGWSQSFVPVITWLSLPGRSFSHSPPI